MEMFLQHLGMYFLPDMGYLGVTLPLLGMTSLNAVNSMKVVWGKLHCLFFLLTHTFVTAVDGSL